MTMLFNNLLSSNAFLALPQQLNWNAQALADAVPARLSEAYALDSADTCASANRGHRSRPGSYLTGTASALFRIRG